MSSSTSAAVVPNASQVTKPGTLTAEEDAAAKKQEALNAAVARFNDISKSLGGHEQAKAFFDTYGTDGFKPEPSNERELVKAKEMELDSVIKDHSEKKLKMPGRPEGFGAKYIDDPAWDIEEPSEINAASELTGEQWQELFDATKMLHGYVLNNRSGLSRARFQAFQPKPRPAQNYTDAASAVPDYEVFDASSISIKETKSQAERSMAQNGFSSEAISASVSVSTPFVGGSASASYSTESQSSKASSDFSDRQEFTATYNFPRARVFLDELNLEVTPECAKYLVRIQDAAKKIKDNIDRGLKEDADGAVTNAGLLVNKFFARFGHIFACTVQLGGQLTSTKSAASFASVKDEQKRDAMQAAVAVSVESSWVSASASYSKGKTEESESRAANTDSSSALAWNARGGNTLLCANPAAWANSVAGYKQWRVMEQENVLALPALISRLERAVDGSPAWPDIAKMFSTIAQNKYNEIPPVPPGTWTGKIKFETIDGQKVAIKDGYLSVLTDGDATVFTVLDADLKRRSETVPQLPQLYADHPLFLVSSSEQVARQSQTDGGQFPGLSVDSKSTDGKILGHSNNISRWSLRPGSILPARNTAISAPWAPDKIVLHDGDEIGLFNHSYYAGGSFTMTENPPYYAPFAAKKGGDTTIRLLKIDPEGLMKSSISENLLKSPSWAFTNPDRASIQSLMERSDRGAPMSSSEKEQIETYRKFFGLNIMSNWTDTYQPLLIWRPSGIGSTTGWPVLKATDKSNFLNTELDRSIVSWASANGFAEAATGGPGYAYKVEPLRLRVRFVN